MRDFVHVDDVARANLAALSDVAARETGAWRPTTCARGRPCTILDVARLVGRGEGR